MSILEIILTSLNVIIESVCTTFLIIVAVDLINSSDNLANSNKIDIMHLFLVIFISYVINRLIHIFLPDFKWLKSIIFATFTTFGAVKFLRVKVFKGIISSIIFLLYIAIIEVISVLILKCFNITPHKIVSNIIYNNLYACTLSIIEACIGLIIYKFKKMYNKTLSSVENKLKYFVPQLIAIVICMLPTMALLMLNNFKYSTLFVLVNLLQLLVVAFVGMYNLNFVAKHENTEQELANTIIYNETLSKVNEGVRGFKHDMGNIVQAILGYIAINDAEGAKKYCQNLVIGFNDINILSILSPKVIDDPAIYGVVVNKILIAREKNLTLSLDITADVANINFPKFELSRILGILIDNAIEAAEESEDKKLIVDIRHDYKNNTDVIKIANSVKDINIDLEKLFTKNYSTKANPSGFGLYEVAKFLKKFPQGNLNTTIDKNSKIFSQILTIK